jgi:hypothetical protein
MSVTIPTDTQTTPESSEVSAELRKEAIVSLKRKRSFAENVVGYVSVNGVLWLIWALTDRSSGGSLPWPAWVSLIWGFLLVMDAWRAYGRWPRSLHRPITEVDIEREVNRSRGAGR